MGRVVVMTAIKQVSIMSAAHAKSLGRYLNDERALARDSQNLINDKNWELEMARTRKAYGHDKPSRSGTQSRIMIHRILGFNPDECSMNSGPMTPEKCMNYAKEYVSSYLPDYECVWVLHREHCDADSTDRWAIHIGINITNLKTGNRLHEGSAKQTKIAHANQIRDLDREWGLRQLKANQRNSKVHARQPTIAEKAIAARGHRSDKQYIRDAIKVSIKQVNSHSYSNRMQALSDELKKKGVRMTKAKNGTDITFERVKTGRKANGTKLGRGYSKTGILKALGIQMGRSMSQESSRDIEY